MEDKLETVGSVINGGILLFKFVAVLLILVTFTMMTLLIIDRQKLEVRINNLEQRIEVLEKK